MKRTLFLLALVGVFGSAGAQPLLYDQPIHAPGAAGGNGLSFPSSTAPPRWAADDFVVPVPGWNITHVDLSYAFADTQITAFSIRFLSNAAGMPGADLGPTQTSTSFTRALVPGTYFGGQVEKVVVALPTAVSLAAGTYWMAAQAVGPNNTFLMTAAAQVGGQGHGFGHTPNPAVWQPWTTIVAGTTAQDFAFSLHGTPVPEPATMLVVAAGLAMLRRRRKA